ncbi:MAG TPA: AAA family ATPase [Dehalococcoidia bacterium]|nr:AAA family ATPase [Dehalococcoidia bacterium]
MVATKNPPFVGRLRELEVLTRIISRALAGEPQVALLQGEAGIGKSRLLREASQIAAARDAEVVQIRFLEDPAPPLEPFIASLAPLLEDLPDWDDQVVSRWRAASGEDEARVARGALFQALSSGLQRLGRGRPLLLALDDLQWADAASLDLLEHLVFWFGAGAARAKVAVAVLAAHRRPEPEGAFARAVARLRREDICTRLDLRRLGRFEVDAIARGLGVADPSPQLVDWLFRTSEGNAFMAVELATAVARNGVPADQGVPLPRELTAPALARLQGVGPACRDLVMTAAVLGQRISLALLAAVSGREEGEVASLLAEAEDAGLGFLHGEAFEFEHPLLRAALYRRQAPSRRRELHLLAARRLQESGATADPALVTEVAHHLVEAGPLAPADSLARFARAAGDAARSALAWADAARFYRALLESPAAQGLDPAGRADVQYAYGYVLHSEGDLASARAMYQAAAAAYEQLGNRAALAKALIEKVNAELQPGGPGVSPDIRPLEQLLATLEDSDPLVAPVCAQLADAYFFTGNAEAGRERALRAAGAAAQAGDAKSGMYANLTLGRIALQAMDVDASVAYYRESLRLARLGPDAWQRTAPLQRAPNALLAQGRLDEAEALAREGFESGLECGTYGGAALAAATLAGVETLRGDFDAAERLCAEGLHLVRRSGYRWALPALASALVGARVASGAAALAREALDSLFEGAGGARSLRAYIDAHEAVVEGRLPPADSRLALRWRGDMDDLPNLCAAVDALHLAGRLPEDPRTYAALKAACDEGGVRFEPGLPFLVPRILGLLASAAGLQREARDHFGRAIEIASATGAKLELARTRLDLARALAQAGAAREAREQAEAAAALVAGLRSRTLTAIAHSLASSLGMAKAPERSPGGLTYHEEAVLEQYAAGRPAEAIAGSLAMSPSTVQSTLEVAQAKVGVTDPGSAAGFLVASPAAGRRRAAAVILFTDVVESVQLTEKLGDEAAHEVVRRLHEALRNAILEHSGEVVPGVLLGDGLLATFASASQALAAALEIRRKAESQGVSLHIGLHAGDVIREGAVISGGAVNIAARIRDACPPGSILASSTVRELAMTSSGAVFEDLGMQTLRGIAEPRRLYAVHPASQRPASYPDRLSEREVEVLKLLAAGRSNQQIADELVISLNTVLRHVSNIYAKVGAANRADAVSYAYRHGLAT